MNVLGWVTHVKHTDLGQESNQIYAYALALAICLKTNINMRKFMEELLMREDIQFRLSD